MDNSTDIDIDFADPRKALEGVFHIPATLVTRRGIRQKHPSGAYFQDVPTNPVTGLCAYSYQEAEQLGYFKIDFLANTIYEGVRDEEHLEQLLDREPDWSLLEHAEIVETLAHIHNHFGVVKTIGPRSIEDLAIVLALIRPGKRHLVNQHRDQIEAEIWSTGTDGFHFKKSHSISYAASIVVQLNLICERMAEQLDAKC